MDCRFPQSRKIGFIACAFTCALLSHSAHAQTEAPPPNDSPPPVTSPRSKYKPLPPNADDCLRHAAVFFRMGDYARAIENLSQAIELRPDIGQLFRNRGNTYLQIAFAERRVQVYSSRLASKPESATLYLGRGFAYYNAGEYAKAIGDCDAALARFPDYAAAYLTRALAHDAAGHPEQAAADYNRAFALQPLLRRVPPRSPDDVKLL